MDLIKIELPVVRGITTKVESATLIAEKRAAGWNVCPGFVHGCYYLEAPDNTCRIKLFYGSDDRVDLETYNFLYA